LANSDREELMRLRAAERLRQRKATERRAVARAKEKEGAASYAAPQPLEFELLRSVLQYAEERMHEASWLQDDMRQCELVPLTVDVAEVPLIREMVRRYAQALSNVWRFSLEHPAPSNDMSLCAHCGAPRLEVKLDISDRPSGVPDRSRPSD